MSLGMGIWKIVVDGYQKQANPPTNKARKKKYESNIKVVNAILVELHHQNLSR